MVFRHCHLVVEPTNSDSPFGGAPCNTTTAQEGAGGISHFQGLLKEVRCFSQNDVEILKIQDYPNNNF